LFSAGGFSSFKLDETVDETSSVRYVFFVAFNPGNRYGFQECYRVLPKFFPGD
jgi:hypothetical protein